MNRRPSGLSVSKAHVGFLNTKAAEGLSPRTLQSYEHRLGQWIEYTGDVAVGSISSQDIRRNLTWLRTDYKPKRFNGDERPLSSKTVRNVYVTLSSFFTWTSTEFDIKTPMEGVPTPTYKAAPVIPFTRDEIEAMLDVCEFTRRADTTDRRRFRGRRATARRDRAIILTLLDTGLRASELCALKVGDTDLKIGRVEDKHGPRGGAKGGMGRTVFLGKTARRFVWRYLAEREDGEDPDALLFAGRWDRPMNPDSLRQLLKALGEKAGVRNCHPQSIPTYVSDYLPPGRRGCVYPPGTAWA